MKKRMILLTLVFSMVAFSLVGCGEKSANKEEINLMTWGGDFIPREIIKGFEDETGIKVNYKEVTSNEDMQSLLEANPDQYDLAVVTDYMADIMVKNQYLEKWDTSKMDNFENINPVYQNNYYDEDNQYSIPYAVSTAFLLVNEKEIAKLGLDPIKSYKDLWQEGLKSNVVIIDGAVEIMGMTLKSLGYNYNETDPKKVEDAKEQLFKLRDNIVRFETNTPEDSLINKEALAGFMYSNQAVKGNKMDKDLVPVFPEEGMPIYIDSFVMSKEAPNKDNAYKLLNYLMDPKVSAKISEITNFTNANKKATEFLPEEFKSNPMLNLSDDVVKNTDFYINVEDVLDSYDHIYSEFKIK